MNGAREVAFIRRWRMMTMLWHFGLILAHLIWMQNIWSRDFATRSTPFQPRLHHWRWIEWNFWQSVLNRVARQVGVSYYHGDPMRSEREAKTAAEKLWRSRWRQTFTFLFSFHLCHRKWKQKTSIAELGDSISNKIHSEKRLRTWIYKFRAIKMQNVSLV